MKTKLNEEKITQALDSYPLESLPTHFTSRTMQRVRQAELLAQYKKEGLFINWVIPAFFAGFAGLLIFLGLVLFNLRDTLWMQQWLVQIEIWWLTFEPIKPVLIMSGGSLLGLLVFGIIGGYVYWLMQMNRQPNFAYVQKHTR